MLFQKIKVYKIPPGGEGVYSQLKAYKLHYSFGIRSHINCNIQRSGMLCY